MISRLFRGIGDLFAYFADPVPISLPRRSDADAIRDTWKRVGGYLRSTGLR